MRSIFLATFAAVGLLAATAAYADNTQAPPAQQTAMTDKKDEVVCKVVTHEGMVTNQVVCHTRKRWDTIRRNTDQAISEFQLHSLSNPM